MNDEAFDAPSAGAMLREAREKQGLHIAALAAAIKVAPRKLDALENDRWDELPDATFVRALAQTVCRSLKIDARPVLDRLPPAGASALDSGGGLNAPFRDRPGRDEPRIALAAVRPMFWAASLLMVAAVVVYSVPEGLFSPRRRLPVATPASAPAFPAAVVVAASSASESAETVAAPFAASAAPAVTTLVAPEVARPAPAVPVASVAAGAPAIATAQAPPALPAKADVAPPAGPLLLRTSQASWIEVRDARGRVLLARIVQPGESLGLDGTLPVRLIIGNAAATQLGFRGMPIDLGPSTRDNVARLELK